MNGAVNVLALVKEETNEKYVFLYDDESALQLLRQLGKSAADPELSFTWYDAAILAKRVGRLKRNRT